MITIIPTLERYLHETLGLTVMAIPWKQEGGVPFFLKDSYDFYEMELLGSRCVLMIAKGNEEPTPARVCKHIKQVQNKWQGICIYVQPAMSAYNRKRLIEQKVAFVVPGNQMYLPELNIDLREYFRKWRTMAKALSPSAQVVIIAALLGRIKGRALPSDLAKQFGYSTMSMSRVLDMIEAAELSEVNQEGRERWLSLLSSKTALWEKARTLMRDPVKKRVWVDRIKGTDVVTIKSGLSALAEHTLLNPPRQPVYAISKERWKMLQQSGVNALAEAEDGVCELEVWSYNPELTAQGQVVDTFSLYLSLQKNKDERVETALNQMMEQIKW